MSDVDKLQIAEEAASQRAQEAEQKKREKMVRALRAEPLRATALIARRDPVSLDLDQIHPGENIRPDLPEIQELARSIREVGLLTPLLVRPWDPSPTVDGALPKDSDETKAHYRLIAGHRRLAALLALTEAGINGFSTILCEVRDGISEAEMYALMLTENVQRVPLEPIQSARALRLLLDLNPELDAGALARSLGVRPAWAQTHLKLLDLPQDVQDRIEAGDLSVTIADLLRRGQSTGRLNEDKVREIAHKVATGEITTAEAKKAAAPPKKPNTEAPKTVRREELEEKENLAEQWERITPSSDQNNELVRPATPLSSPEGSPLTTPLGTPLSSSNASDFNHGTSSGSEASNSNDGEVMPVEEQLDAFLLGKALHDWASDDYLDRLGIDRVQTHAWAEALDFDERIGAIRRLSYTLMQQEKARA